MLSADERGPRSIIWLGEAASRDGRAVGGKAAGLAPLVGRYPVPDGFCVPWDLFDDRGAVEESLVEAAYRRLDPTGEAPLAVRSSAVGEDGDESSFAGQHTTVLAVRGLSALLSALQACWRSAEDESARVYRRVRGAEPEGHSPRMAVLVQRLVAADVAAVAFSRDPIRPDSGEMVINATWGLGEPIVSGSGTPDVFAVRRDDFSVVRRQIAVKQDMAIVAEEGIRHVPVPRRLRELPCLSGEQVLALARILRDLEHDARRPVDVESAWAEGRWHVLQCRPITAL